MLNLNSVMVGLQYLFLEPNADDPLNKGKFVHLIVVILAKPFFTEAALEMSKNRDQFLQNVKQSMRGGHIKGVHYDSVLS